MGISESQGGDKKDLQCVGVKDRRDDLPEVGAPC